MVDQLRPGVVGRPQLGALLVGGEASRVPCPHVDVLGDHPGVDGEGVDLADRDPLAAVERGVHQPRRVLVVGGAVGHRQRQPGRGGLLGDEAEPAVAAGEHEGVHPFVHRAAPRRPL